MWHIQFMQTPTGMIVDVDPNVDAGTIAEYGTEKTTGILLSHYNGTISRMDQYPELQAHAETAANIPDRTERRAAWKAIEAESRQIASKIKLHR